MQLFLARTVPIALLTAFAATSSAAVPEEQLDVPQAAFEECDAGSDNNLHLLQKRARQAMLQDAPTNETSADPDLHTFYVYRSMSYQEFPFGNVNVANLPGVLWYLTNEVLPRCPKRYNITQIKRFKLTYKATPELRDIGMNFGVRYSYDAGACTGSNTIRMGPCSKTWNNFGYVLGCNNFADRYPWPVVGTAYPEGIWYDLPIEGKCDKVTGERNCTWSYEDAGAVLIEEELEQQHPGVGYYCHGRSTNFWSNQLSKGAGNWRAQQVLDAFAKKYPDMARDLPPPKCDFNKKVFWEHAV